MSESQALVDKGGGRYEASLYRNDRLAEYVARAEDVTPRDLSDYSERGYLALQELYSAEQVGQALDALADLVTQPRGATVQMEAGPEARLQAGDAGEEAMPNRTEVLDGVRKLADFAGVNPTLRAFAYHPTILGLVRRVLGVDEVVLSQSMALLKPPGGGREKPWHQDNAFFRVKPGSPIVGVWIALDRATFENGCMHVLPGTHREGPVIHFRRRDFQICDDDVQLHRDTVVPLDAGGALFFDGLLHHGTPQNRTVSRRRALQFHYVPKGHLMVSDEERMAVFGAEGKDATC